LNRVQPCYSVNTLSKTRTIIVTENTIAKAAVLCPHGIFIPGRMGRYAEVSGQILSLLHDFSPLVEPISIDEAFLDMTGCEHFYASLERYGDCIEKANQGRDRFNRIGRNCPQQILGQARL